MVPLQYEDILPSANAYFDRRHAMEVCDGPVPELQRRGLTRKAWARQHSPAI